MSNIYENFVKRYQGFEHLILAVKHEGLRKEILDRFNKIKDEIQHVDHLLNGATIDNDNTLNLRMANNHLETIFSHIAGINKYLREPRQPALPEESKEDGRHIVSDLSEFFKKIRTDWMDKVRKPDIGITQSIDSLLGDATSLNHEMFITGLKKLAEFFTRCGYRLRQCFISYAWPEISSEKSGIKFEIEMNVQKLLKLLRNHLNAVGITTILDICDNTHGGNIIAFANQISESNSILLIGTESLLSKHLEGLRIVTQELNSIKRKRVADASMGKPATVYPILLSGSIERSFPPEFECYTTVRDWRKAPYIVNLKAIIRVLYGEGLDNQEVEAELSKLDSSSQMPLEAVASKYSSVEQPVSAARNIFEKLVEIQKAKMGFAPAIDRMNLIVPFPIANFVERIDLKGDTYEVIINNSLRTANKCVISGVTVIGIPGTGKTQLALYFAHQNRNNYENSYFIDAESNKNIIASFRTFLKNFVDYKQQIEIDFFDEQRVLSETQNKFAKLSKSLFTFDNVENEEYIKKWLPPKNHHVLVTSRHRVWELFKTVIYLDVFNEKEKEGVINFVLEKLKEETKKSAFDLANKLGWLPLAIGQAVCTMGSTMSIKEYLSKYEESYEEKKKLLADNLLSADKHKKTVLITWHVAINKLEKENNPHACRTLLNICAYLYGGRIPKRLFAGYFNNLQEITRIICDHYGLMDVISYNEPRDSLKIHRLLQEVIRIEHTDKNEMKKWVTETLKLLVNAFNYDFDDIETISNSQLFITQVEFFIENYNKEYCFESKDDIEDEQNLCRLLCRVATYYLHHERNADIAYTYLEQAEKILEKYKKITESLHMEIYNQLAFVYQKRMVNTKEADRKENYEKAINYSKKVIDIENRRGWYTAFAYCIIALSEYENKKLDAAERNYEIALKIYEDIQKTTNQYLRATNRLADIYSDDNKTKEAEEKFKKAIEGFEKARWERNPYIVRAYESYARFLKKMNRYDEALKYCKKALDTHQIIYGDNKNQYYMSLNSLKEEIGGRGRVLDTEHGLEERSSENRKYDSSESMQVFESVTRGTFSPSQEQIEPIVFSKPPAGIAPKQSFFPLSLPSQSNTSTLQKSFSAIQRLLQSATITPQRNQDNNMVELLFMDQKLAEQCQQQLLSHYGIHHLGDPKKEEPRKITVMESIDTKALSFKMLLTGEEYNIVSDDQGAYAKLVSHRASIEMKL